MNCGDGESLMRAKLLFELFQFSSPLSVRPQLGALGNLTDVVFKTTTFFFVKNSTNACLTFELLSFQLAFSYIYRLWRILFLAVVFAIEPHVCLTYRYLHLSSPQLGEERRFASWCLKCFVKILFRIGKIEKWFRSFSSQVFPTFFFVKLFSYCSIQNCFFLTINQCLSNSY